MLNELITGNSQADIVAINGTSTVYEIKTGLDNVKRLPEQIANYTKAFDLVNVLTEESKIEEIKNCLISTDNKNIGIIFLQGNKLETIKEAKSNIESWNLELMFSILRQKQIKEHFGVKKLTEAKELFCSLSKENAHEIFKKLLVNKVVNNYDYIVDLPYSLKMAGYALQTITKTQKQIWLSKLQNPVYI